MRRACAPPGAHASSSSIETSTRSTVSPAERPQGLGDARLHRARDLGQRRPRSGRRARARPWPVPSATVDVRVHGAAVRDARALDELARPSITSRRRAASPSIRMLEAVSEPLRSMWPSRLTARASQARRQGQRAPSISARKLVEYSPLANSAERRMSSASARVVGTPSSSISSSARTPRAIAAGRSSAQTTSFAISES